MLVREFIADLLLFKFNLTINEQGVQSNHALKKLDQFWIGLDWVMKDLLLGCFNINAVLIVDSLSMLREHNINNQKRYFWDD